jgi:hypothetical protein
VYLAENKFSVCRSNPAYRSYLGYNKEYFGACEGQLRLVEDFDIEWHLTSFLKTKLTKEKPSLIFRWMMTKKPKQEQQPSFNIIIKHSIPPKQEKSYPDKKTAQPIEKSKPIWIVKKVLHTSICECGKRSTEYIATLYVRPNKDLDKTRITVERCEICLNNLKKSFSNAIWKIE